MLRGDLCERSTGRGSNSTIVRARSALGSSGSNDCLCSAPDRCFRLAENLCHLGAGTCGERPPHNPNFVVAERSPAFSHPNSSRWDLCDNQVRTPRVVVIGGPHLPVPNNGGDR